MEWGWVLIGGGALWAAYRTGRQMELEAHKRQRTTTLWHTEIQHLGLIAPVAALLGAGRISQAMAEEEIELQDRRSPGVRSTWSNMTGEERKLVGVEFITLMDLLEQRRENERRDAGLKKWFPEVWKKKQEKRAG